ncbi:MAG: pantothenate synthetase [Chloroflexota bacterium]|nr:MAG: pantothenate synthetase [Chloroflexota bacterium]
MSRPSPPGEAAPVDARTADASPVDTAPPDGRPTVVRTRRELREAVARLPRPIGFVPTMGALHEGHRALIRRARTENAGVVVSIFVNPRQFERADDLAAYPRTEAEDLAVCRAEGVDVVFIPPVEEIYPAGFQTTVRVGALAEPLEGAARPGHLEGVTTVVAILFGLVGAERSYFGEKDAQQLRVVRRMVADLAIPTEIVACPTVREPDGLACSSRNVRLSARGRAAAPLLHRALLAGRARILAGERSAEAVREAIRAVIGTEPAIELDYVSAADEATLDELETIDRPTLLSLAARIEGVRLIDNELVVPLRGTAQGEPEG